MCKPMFLNYKIKNSLNLIYKNRKDIRALYLPKKKEFKYLFYEFPA